MEPAQVKPTLFDHPSSRRSTREAQTDKGKLTKASVKGRLAAAREGGSEVTVPGEIEMPERHLELAEGEAAASRKVKEAQKALDAHVTAGYQSSKPWTCRS